MGISALAYVVFAVSVYHAVVVGLYYAGIWRTPGWWQDARVRGVAHRTVAASTGLSVLYLTGALLAFQFLPVGIGYPLFVAAWAGHGVLLLSLLLRSRRRASTLRAAGVS